MESIKFPGESTIFIDDRTIEEKFNDLEKSIEILHNMITLISRHLNLELEDEI